MVPGPGAYSGEAFSTIASRTQARSPSPTMSHSRSLTGNTSPGTGQKYCVMVPAGRGGGLLNWDNGNPLSSSCNTQKHLRPSVPRFAGAFNPLARPKSVMSSVETVCADAEDTGIADEDGLDLDALRVID